MNRFVLPFLAAVSLGTATMAEDVTIATAQGDVTLAAKPAKVVVYDIAAIDTLVTLGVPLAGVPDNLYLSDLEAEDAVPVGTLFEPDLEALAGLAPDLVIVGGRSVTQLDAVSQVAPAIDMTIGTDVIAEAEARIDAYGRLFGVEDQAEIMRRALDVRLEQMKTAAEGKGTALIVMTNGPKMAAYGPGSRFGWLHEKTGMAPAIADLNAAENHGNVLTHEAIAEANPDWLFVLDRGAAVGEEGASAEQTLKTPLVEGTNAWKNGHVVYLPAAEMYIGGGGWGSLITVITALTDALSA